MRLGLAAKIGTSVGGMDPETQLTNIQVGNFGGSKVAPLYIIKSQALDVELMFMLVIKNQIYAFGGNLRSSMEFLKCFIKSILEAYEETHNHHYHIFINSYENLQ